jgi:hypothetical protein
MLGVEQDPVEARVGDDLSAEIAAECTPEADLQLTPPECPLEFVASEVHRVFPID